MAAPASAASMDARAISSGVMGKYGVIVGVWIEPVTAQVMMTLRPGLDPTDVFPAAISNAPVHLSLGELRYLFQRLFHTCDGMHQRALVHSCRECEQTARAERHASIETGQ